MDIFAGAPGPPLLFCPQSFFQRHAISGGWEESHAICNRPYSSRNEVDRMNKIYRMKNQNPFRILFPSRPNPVKNRFRSRRPIQQD